VGFGKCSIAISKSIADMILPPNSSSISAGRSVHHHEFVGSTDRSAASVCHASDFIEHRSLGLRQFERFVGFGGRRLSSDLFHNDLKDIADNFESDHVLTFAKYIDSTTLTLLKAGTELPYDSTTLIKEGLAIKGSVRLPMNNEVAQRVSEIMATAFRSYNIKMAEAESVRSVQTND
jgi:hypothetical protein